MDSVVDAASSTERRWRATSMGLLDRFKSARGSAATPEKTPPPSSAQVMTVSAHLHTGDEDLKIVGEANYQEALWAICGGSVGDRIRHRVVAVVIPEPENPHDENAISIQIDGQLVGYLARDVAVRYGPGLKDLMTRCGGYVALEGVIVGGGYYNDGPGKLGVWLEHDPRDFGLESGAGHAPGRPGTRPVGDSASMRTGLSEAWLTDVDDDSYDLSWFDDLPEGDRRAITRLRELLAIEADPIDRHFQFAELETRLYRCRDLYETALEEFDAACQLHDAEMETICSAFESKWGKIPLLNTYRQMAIRQQKQQDWQASLWWAERGLALYGSAAAREDAVEDLLKRRNRAMAKLELTPKAYAGVSSAVTTDAGMAELPGRRPPADAVRAGGIETLVCGQCDSSFERIRVRGRKPLLCPDCRSNAS
jgi:hypothetical protein